MIRSSLLALALALAACSSKPKEIDPAAQPAVAPVAAQTKAPSAVAVPAVTADGVSQVVCEKGKDHRTLEVRTKDKGCELSYSKGGQAAVVSSSAHGTKHCEASLKKIRGKLEGAGYACK